MDTPTAADIRAYPFKFDWTAAGYPPPAAPGDPDGLDVAVAWAVGYVEQVTGQHTGPGIPDPLDTDTGVSLVPLMQQAIGLRTIQLVSQGAKDYLGTIADFDIIQSFSAGNYSESRKDAARRGEQKEINSWPPINELLWLLMTPDRYAYWLAWITNTPVPAWQVSEVDWTSGQIVAGTSPFDWNW